MQMFKCSINYVKTEEKPLICPCQKYQKYVKFLPEGKSKENFASTFKFCKGHLNKFIRLLRKGVYP